MGNINLQEAFKALSVLNEEDFNLSSTEDIEELKDTIEEEDIDDTIDIIDVEAETEDEIKESYIGDVILDCSICHSKLYKKPDEVEIDEETELANITEECPYCFSTDGYNIIGEIAPYGKEDEDEEEDIEVEDEEEIEEGCSGKNKSKKLKEAKSVNTKTYKYKVEELPASEYPDRIEDTYKNKYNLDIKVRENPISKEAGSMYIDIYAKNKNDLLKVRQLENELADYDEYWFDESDIILVESSKKKLKESLKRNSKKSLKESVDEVFDTCDAGTVTIFDGYADKDADDGYFVSINHPERDYGDIEVDCYETEEDAKKAARLAMDLIESSYKSGELSYSFDEYSTNNILRRIAKLVSTKMPGIDSHYNLDEALPRDLMGQIRKNGARGYRGFNGGSNIYRDWKGNEYTGIQDYANASYEEISAEDVLSRKKNGEDLSNIYVLKNGVMIKLDSEGHPDIDKSTEAGMRANQSLRKTLTDADKIYSTDIKDLIDSNPEKAATRLADEDERAVNYRLGHDRQKYSWDKRRDSDYVKNLQRRSTLKSQIDGIKASYDAGDISRKEMESKIASLKNRYAPSDWEAKNYQNARNRNADDRYYSSNKELQQPINDLRRYRDDISYAKRRLVSAQRDLEQTNSGEGSSFTEYTYAKRQIDEITKKIASLQRQLDYYQQKIDNGAQAKDIEKYTKEIEDSQAEINAAQANIDKLLRRNKTESLKEDFDISEYQKWVDYDMEKLGRISKLTMNKIKHAGFSVVKDQYGDYEVIADRKDESLTESSNKFTLRKKDGVIVVIDEQGNYVDHFSSVDDMLDSGYCIDRTGFVYRCNESLKEDFDMDSKVTIGIYGDEVREINARSVSDIVKYLKRKGFEVTDIDGDIDYGWEMNVTGYPKDLFAAICNVFPGYNQDSVSDFINAYSIDESLKEDFERVSIETDREKMEMSSDSNGKVTVTTEPKEYMSDEEVIAPVSDDVQKEINPSFDEEEVEDEDSVDVDFDEFSEEEFDELGESYLKKVYENVNSFKTSSVKMSPNSLIIEGIIGFNSGNSKKTSFIFEGKDITKRGKVRFIGENLQLTKGKKSFTLRGSMKGNKFIAESLNYNYKTKDNEGNSTRLYGTVKVKH